MTRRQFAVCFAAAIALAFGRPKPKPPLRLSVARVDEPVVLLGPSLYHLNQFKVPMPLIATYYANARFFDHETGTWTPLK